MSHDAPIVKVELRDKLGTTYARRLRKIGRMPATIYSKGTDPISVSIDEKEILTHLHKGSHVMELDNGDGNTATVLVKDLQFAKDFEVGGFMLIPSFVGYNLIFSLAQSDDFNLPILTHPSFSGSNVLSHNTGFSYGMFYGKIQRLIGSDMSIFPNIGGRFNFTKEDCQSIASACRSIDGPGKPIFPSIGGGMSLKTADKMKYMYGNDAVYLLGGSLLRYGDRIGEGILDIKKALY
jgi:ribulose-bisphosphate carboxylase large chain